MRALLQRVSEANVSIDKAIHSSINEGLLILIGIENEDSEEDVGWLVKKISQMRIFEDEEGKMNNSILDISGEILVVSQFTLHANTKKGNRPSFIKAARPEKAILLYEIFIESCQNILHTKSGIFGAEMKVALINDGPVTIWLDSKNKE